MPNVQADGEHVGQYEGGADRGHPGLGGGARVQGYSGGVTTDGAVLCPYNCDNKYFYKMKLNNPIRKLVLIAPPSSALTK